MRERDASTKDNFTGETRIVMFENSELDECNAKKYAEKIKTSPF
jgi:hypothetical protein